MVSLNITSGDKPNLRSTLILVMSTFTEEVVLHLFHKSGPVNQVNAGKSIPHERNGAERTAEFLTAYTDHLRLIRSAHPFQTIINFIERNDLLADFLAQFRPIVLHCFKLFADTFAVGILALALHETSCQVTRLAVEYLMNSLLHLFPLRPLSHCLVDVH